MHSADIKDKHNEYKIKHVNKEITDVIQEEMDQLITILKLTNGDYHIKPNFYSDHCRFKFNIYRSLADRVGYIEFTTTTEFEVEHVMFVENIDSNNTRHCFVDLTNNEIDKLKELFYRAKLK